MITHNESISIADYFTLREDGNVIYRPTCHYGYHPCDDTVLSLHELTGAQWKPRSRWHILNERSGFTVPPSPLVRANEVIE